VQRGVRHGGPAHEHGFEHGVRREHAGASGVDLDVVEPRLRDVGGELARGGPARFATAHHAEVLLHAHAIHLHHAAVDREVELRAHRVLHVVRPRVHVGHARAARAMRGDGYAPRCKLLEQRPLRIRRWQAVGQHRRVAEEAQRTLRRDRGIELPQRAGGGVARIGEHGFPLAHARLVHRLEPVERQVDLAADLEARRCVAAQSQRHVAHRADVGRDVLARRAVAARRARHQQAVHVRERHRRAVDLELDRVAAVDDIVARHAHQARFPFDQLVGRKRVAERQHRYQVRVTREAALHGCANAKRRRVGRLQARPGGLESLQLAESRIVLRVTE